jgi:6-phosphogluconolactonase
MEEWTRATVSGFGVLLALVSSGAGATPPEHAPSRAMVHVGTYTGGASRGIYRFELDLETGEPTTPVLAAEAPNPAFLALHPSGRVLYALSEVTELDGQRSGAVSAFALDPATGALAFMNRVPSGGPGPCHVTVDRAGRNVLVANYVGGSVAVLPVSADGRLQQPSSLQQHHGTGPNAARQEAPHAHGIVLDRKERFAFAPDLGADRIFIYDFDAAHGVLRSHAPPAAALAPGSGPRHVAFHPDGRFLYAINELLSTVTAFRYDAANAGLTAFQTVSTLPPGFSGRNTTAEIAVSADGRFLYGSNRGHDSIAVFSIDAPSGRLSPIGHVPTGGRTPRHFALDPTGRWLLAANQDSGNVVVFRLEAGMPEPTGRTVAVDRPVCVLITALP